MVLLDIQAIGYKQPTQLALNLQSPFEWKAMNKTEGTSPRAFLIAQLIQRLG